MFIVYKTTNLVNDKYYIGIHKIGQRTNSYLGSGTRLKYAIQKHGKENFIRETIFENLDEDTAKKIESMLVNDKRIQDPNCYNLAPGGGYPPPQTGVPKSEGWKVQVAEAQKKSWASGNRTQHLQSEQFKQNMRLNNPSKDPRVKSIQSQKRKDYWSNLSQEQRSQRNMKSAATRKVNTTLKVQHNV